MRRSVAEGEGEETTVCAGGDAVGAVEELPAGLLEGVAVELAARGGGGGGGWWWEGEEDGEEDEGEDGGEGEEGVGYHVGAWGGNGDSGNCFWEKESKTGRNVSLKRYV